MQKDLDSFRGFFPEFAKIYSDTNGSFYKLFNPLFQKYIEEEKTQPTDLSDPVTFRKRIGWLGQWRSKMQETAQSYFNSSEGQKFLMGYPYYGTLSPDQAWGVANGWANLAIRGLYYYSDQYDIALFDYWYISLTPAKGNSFYDSVTDVAQVISYVGAAVTVVVATVAFAQAIPVIAGQLSGAAASSAAATATATEGVVGTTLAQTTVASGAATTAAAATTTAAGGAAATSGIGASVTALLSNPTVAAAVASGAALAESEGKKFLEQKFADAISGGQGDPEPAPPATHSDTITDVVAAVTENKSNFLLGAGILGILFYFL